MINVALVAQQVLDYFYQDVPSTEDATVIDLGFAINECLSARNFLLEEEFKEERKMDIGLYGDDYPLTLISAEWAEPFRADLVFDEELNEWYAPIPVAIFSFPYDRYSLGVQNITPLGECNDLLRIRLNEAWVACAFDVTADSVSWYVQGNRVVFKNISKGCFKKVIMYLIPSYSDCDYDKRCTAIIPDGKEFKIKQLVLESMYRAYQVRLGKIDVMANQNPNPAGTPNAAPVNSLSN